MNRTLLFLLLTVVVGGAIGYAFYRQHRTENHLHVQLRELEALLLADNIDAAQSAERAVKGIHASVLKNQSQPQEITVLAAAEKLSLDADSIDNTLNNHAEKLLVATRNITSQSSLPHPGETRTVEQMLGHDSRALQALRQQLATYSTALSTLNPTAALHLSEPEFDGLPVVAALAHLAQLGSEVRTAEASALRHLASQIGATRLSPHLVALASSESNTVAPGAVYSARLHLANVLGPLPASIQMRCNGQPISVDSNFMGRVRFVAPTRPGAVTWTGTIRFRVSGRDTTFQIKVPYQVARL